ncbi:hypothetical protein R3P38DRAFT_2784206 [Favolaschia claudopus]|uniref:Uncharacterized protein n=1 Tax=Favolaschia claudopus TaxID=2862362 RepID=A0AAW0AYI0_9AGAR
MTSWFNGLLQGLRDRPQAGEDVVDDAASATGSDDASSSDSGSPPPERIESEADLIKIIRAYNPTSVFLLHLLQFAVECVDSRSSTNSPASESADAEVNLWLDLLDHFPKDNDLSTREAVWETREKVLAALLKRRQEEYGSGGTAKTAVHVSTSGVVLPALGAPISKPPKAGGTTHRPSQSQSAPRRPRAPPPISEELVLHHTRPVHRHDALTSTSTPPGGKLNSAPASASSSQNLLIPPPPPRPFPPRPTHDDATSPFLDQLRPTSEYTPRETDASYSKESVPALPAPRVQRMRAAMEKPLANGEMFSLQMMVMADSGRASAVDANAVAPVAAVFVPSEERVECGLVRNVEDAKSKSKSTTNDHGTHLSATSIPRADMSAALTALDAQFTALSSPSSSSRNNTNPIPEIHVHSETALHITERSPANIDEVFVAAHHIILDGAEAQMRAVSFARMCDVVGEGVRDVGRGVLLLEDDDQHTQNNTHTHNEAPAFSLDVVLAPDTPSPRDAMVLFVPDDKRINAKGTDTGFGLVHDSRPTKMVVREYAQRVEGSSEVFGGTKRKRTGAGGCSNGDAGGYGKGKGKGKAREPEEDEEEIERKLKRICGLEGRDTVVRHTKLDMQGDDIWVGVDRRLSKVYGGTSTSLVKAK